MTGDGRFALSSSRVLTPAGLQRAAVVVAGSKIEAVVPPDHVESLALVHDVGNLIISPGIVDAHVHINEPGRTEWEGFASATRAAAAGGVTLLVDMPLNSSPVTASVAALEEKLTAAAGQCTVDVACYGGLIPGNIDELDGLCRHGVCGVKAFLCDSGLDEFPLTSLRDVRAAMFVLGPRETPLLVHAELAEADNSALAPASSMIELAEQRKTWEPQAVAALVALAEETHCPTHIVHVSSAAAVELIRDAKSAGIPVTAETCPHYLTFAVEEFDASDVRYKCMPPIYDAANREQLWQAVADRVIDTIGSDHSPCPPAMKAEGFASAWGGISSLQLTLSIIWHGFRQHGLSLDRMFELLAAAPARLVGVEGKKGQLQPGWDADLCIWDPDELWNVRGAELHHRHKITPYEGRELEGKVRQTYVRGKLVYDDGEFPSGCVGEVLRRPRADEQ